MPFKLIFIEHSLYPKSTTMPSLRSTLFPSQVSNCMSMKSRSYWQKTEERKVSVWTACSPAIDLEIVFKRKVPQSFLESSKINAAELRLS
ncbi:11579_t:CDS:2 [Acaulospora morrowiae]|uniref:11579_t:CDS:1 n=1 Tax=Acaulospora morrowiae TaxID=94023 RepID=A0A9N9N590_9GLOM|nr:11579_t:CDS:2 [Acaulospora morrowiae]